MTRASTLSLPPSPRGRRQEVSEHAEQQAMVPDNPTNQPDVQGLRNMLAIWDVEGPKAEKGSREDRDHRDATTASIYAKYLEQASKEDKEMVGRWTETVNILLTFAALFTAIIAAFLLAVQAEVGPQPSDGTNQILLQILKQFDKTTTVPFELLNPPSAASPRILSWWHASLCCSVSSAFGCLLSKQWIMHYDSQPVWANTTEKKAQLREIRYRSLSTWRFHAIIESLPIILQTSVLLFAIGLAEYLYPVKEHFIIVISFIGVMGAFYFITLLAGTFISSCPYKSPITNFTFRLLGDISTRILAILVIVILVLVSILIRVWYGLSPSLRSLKLKSVSSVINLMRAYLAIDRAGEELDAEFGERSLPGSGGMGAAGVLCWGMMHADPTEVRIEEQEHQAAAEAIMLLPASVGIDASYRVGTFSIWCAQVFRGLESKTPTRSQLLEADVMFHLMHHSTEATNRTQLYVAEAILDKMAEEKDDSLLTEGVLSNYICTAIRKGWSSRHGLVGMQVTGMRATTIAVYLRYQLTSWSLAAPEDRLYRDQVAQEVPAILRGHCLDGAQYTAVVDAVSLIAIALVDDLVPGVRPIAVPSEVESLERLLEALYRLSHYPIHHPPNEIISLAIKSASDVISDPHRIKATQKCPSVKQGRFSSTLLRLLRLAREWWHKQPLGESDSPGTSLVRALHGLLASLIDYNIHSVEGDPGILTFLASEGLTEIFAVYSHPAGPSPLPSPLTDDTADNIHHENATKALDYALGLCHHPQPHSRLLHLLSPRHFDQPSTPGHVLTITDLSNYPHLLRQLISNIEQTAQDSNHRRALLMVCVKARQAITPLRTEKYAGLMSNLESIAAAMFRSGSFLTQPDEEIFNAFGRWDELVAALHDAVTLEHELHEKSGSRQTIPDATLEDTST